jgi:two-component system C4-dicarboxylate transport response regulator DctD
MQQADRGTLFLDEIEDPGAGSARQVPAGAGGARGHALGSNRAQTLDLRVVAAAKSDLADAVAAGTFREDLFHRLDVVRIRIPPLRERRDDVPLLFAHFLARACERLDGPQPVIDDKVRWRLHNHDWPGNVRELGHYAQRVALGLADQTAEPRSRAAAPARTRRDLRGAPDRGGPGRLRRRRPGGAGGAAHPRKTFYDKVERHGVHALIGKYWPSTSVGAVSYTSPTWLTNTPAPQPFRRQVKVAAPRNSGKPSFLI